MGGFTEKKSTEDNKINEYIEKCKESIAKDPLSIKDVNRQTFNFSIPSELGDNYDLGSIDYEDTWAELCRLAVGIYFGKSDIQDKDRCDIYTSMVKKNGNTLQNVNYLDIELDNYIAICKIAVSQSYTAIKYVNCKPVGEEEYFNIFMVALEHSEYARAFSCINSQIMKPSLYIKMCWKSIELYDCQGFRYIDGYVVGHDI